MQEIEEDNKMGKTRDLFKKIRDTKGTFHTKMGSIKDRNGRDLTEAEDIKKRWQEYTELYKKYLHDPDNHDGVITYLEPDILECEVMWALERNRDHSVIFEIASKYCILDSFVDHDGYSISSEGFLPAVVDIMVI